MESPGPQASSKVPMPYVFFPKSNTEDLDIETARRITAGVELGRRASRSSGCQGGPGAARQTTGKGSAEPSSKGERPPIMTPDERAWNDRLIRSFHTRRSVIDAIVLSPNGVVISTLGRQVKVKAKNMDPGRLIGVVFLLLLLIHLILFIWMVGSGFLYFRIVRPFDKDIIRDWLDTLASKEISDIECSITTTVSLYLIKSRVTFYMEFNETNVLSSLFTQSNLRKNWEDLTENIVYLMTQLLTGRQTLSSKGTNKDGKISIYFLIDKKPRMDVAPIPHCFQEYNALKDIWNCLFYQCAIYLATLLTQLYIAVTEVLFKRTPHFADPRDRELTPEQMRTRITIGLEGVAALQRICFFTKLVLMLQALDILLFQRILVTVKQTEYSTRHMAKQLIKAGLPDTQVDLCANLIYSAMGCGTVQCLALFFFHSLAKFYSTLASSKVPQVRLVPSQDESFVT